jgi:protoporphyrinogen oxidase
MFDRFLPYPFQNNIKFLPKDVVLECLLGLIEAQKQPLDKSRFANFEELILGAFGSGIAKHFMMPYNFKVWAHPPAMLGTHWIGERVPVVDLQRMLTNVILDRADVSWGPNNTFKYPRFGGTGGLFQRVAATLEGRIRYRAEVTGVDAKRKRVLLADGTDEGYDDLISTAPLDRLVQSIPDAPPEVRDATSLLLHSGSAIVGVGIRQPSPSTKCWMYFPESNCPYYRVTYLSITRRRSSRTPRLIIRCSPRSLVRPSNRWTWRRWSFRSSKGSSRRGFSPPRTARTSWIRI